MTDLYARLAAPFRPDQVSWRVGTSNKKKRQRELNDQHAKATKGQVLAYIDARDVMDRFDEVCGPDGWQNRYPHADRKTICEIGIRSESGEWVWKSDGAGDSDIEAEKGALSDAFKRAAVRWGVGRYLYHLPTPWVDLDEREQIPQAEMRKLEALLRREAGSSVIAPSSQPPEAGDPFSPAMVDHAISLMRGCQTPAEFAEVWKKNQPGWKATMEDADYRRILVVKVEMVAKLAPKAVAA